MTTPSTPTSSRSLTRREAVWRACDELAASAVKPSLSKVRESHRGGSDTDVQADIQAWFAEVFKRHLALSEGAGLPDEVAALMRGVWEAATASAAGHLQARRDALDELRRECEAEVRSARAASAADQAMAAELGNVLAAERSRTTELSLALSEARDRAAEASAAASELTAQLALAHERARNLSMDVEALETRKARELDDARTAHGEQLRSMRAEASARAAEAAAEQARAEERHRGAEARILAEVDRARSSAAESMARADAERALAISREDALREKLGASEAARSKLAGQLEAMQAALGEAKEEGQRNRDRLEELFRRMPDSKKT